MHDKDLFLLGYCFKTSSRSSFLILLSTKAESADGAYLDMEKAEMIIHTTRPHLTMIPNITAMMPWMTVDTTVNFTCAAFWGILIPDCVWKTEEEMTDCHPAPCPRISCLSPPLHISSKSPQQKPGIDLLPPSRTPLLEVGRGRYFLVSVSFTSILKFLTKYRNSRFCSIFSINIGLLKGLVSRVQWIMRDS